MPTTTSSSRVRPRRLRRRPIGRVGVAVALLISVLAWRAYRGSTSAPIPHLPAIEPPAAVHDRLIIEPDAGLQPVYDLMSSARRTLDMTMYELADASAESLLAVAAARGVRVRVVLDGRLERSHNAAAFGYLRSRGVDVRWSSSRYFVTHEKTFVVDGRFAVVMSLNLASRYYATTRDAAVVDRDPRDVAAIESVFEADLSGRSVVAAAADDLVWSPRQSAADLPALIASARHSLAVESEELKEPATESALVAAARRGVAVTVVMTYQDDWEPAFRRLLAAGDHVRVMYGESPLYIHAKIVVVDAGASRARAFVGSENFSTASLQRDRELGVVLLSPSLVRQLAETVSRDAAAAQPFAA